MKAITSYSWLDDHGAVHFSIPDMLRALRVADTPENRVEMKRALIEYWHQAAPGVPIVAAPNEVN